MDHYIGIDVGTGSARACIIDSSGDIKACTYIPFPFIGPLGLFEDSGN
jgi:ribulose kinase